LSGRNFKAEIGHKPLRAAKRGVPVSGCTEQVRSTDFKKPYIQGVARTLALPLLAESFEQSFCLPLNLHADNSFRFVAQSAIALIQIH
jgi:hypothetical protein